MDNKTSIYPIRGSILNSDLAEGIAVFIPPGMVGIRLESESFLSMYGMTDFEQPEMVVYKPAAAAAPAAPAAAAPAASGNATPSPLPGVVVAVKKNVGDKVKAGEVVMLIEAMKMENEITATKDGTLVAILAPKGTQVQVGTGLFEIA